MCALAKVMQCIKLCRRYCCMHISEFRCALVICSGRLPACLVGDNACTYVQVHDAIMRLVVYMQKELAI